MNEKNALSICDSDTEEIVHVPNKITIDDHRPFGITWDESRMYVAQPTSVLSFSKSLKTPQVVTKGMWYGTHQILHKYGKLFMVSPRIEAVVIYGEGYFLPGKGVQPELPAHFKDKDRLNYAEDVHHYNSIFVQEDRMYLSAHNHDKPSFIECYSYPDFKLLHTWGGLGRQIHNVYVEDGEIFYLDSLGSRAIRSTKGLHIPVGQEGQFVRGLAVTPEVFVVGCFPYDPVRHKRRTGHAFLVIVDRKKQKVKKRIRVENVGNINDIRILDVPDLAHGNPPFWNEKSWDFFRGKNVTIF